MTEARPAAARPGDGRALEKALARAVTKLKADSAALFLRSGSEIVLVATAGVWRGAFGARLGEAAVGVAAIAGELQVEEARGSTSTGNPDRQGKVRAAAPVVLKETIVGVLAFELENEDAVPAESDLESQVEKIVPWLAERVASEVD